MNIDAYLAETGTTAADLAKKVGVTAVSLSRIRRGQQNLPRDVIRRIVEATDGRVSLESLVFPETLA